MSLATNRQGVLIYSTDLSKTLEETYRLPPTSIGVRRIRPSRKVVRNALHRDVRSRKKKKEETLHNSSIQQGEGAGILKAVEIIPSDESQGSRSIFPISSNEAQITAVAPHPTNKIEDSPLIEPPLTGPNVTSDHATLQRNRYHQLEPNKRLLEEELAELKGENSTILPVFLSPPMAHQARCLGILRNNKLENSDNENNKRLLSSELFNKRDDQLNDDLAYQWAKLLKLSMAQAEKDRDNEQMRPMAYTLMPEVWTRLRPIVDAIRNDSELECSNRVTESSVMLPIDSTLSTEMRPSSSRMHHDKSLEVIFECLYNNFPNLHISCGVKFGCDYLLYDGCRKDRHAFAGLRVCVAKQGSQELPLPTAFDLAGYVRVLNTAGKLALLSTIQEIPKVKATKDKNDKESGFYVAIVDLALEKVLTAPTHQRKKSRKFGGKRKEVGLHLDKRNK